MAAWHRMTELAEDGSLKDKNDSITNTQEKVENGSYIDKESEIH